MRFVFIQNLLSTKEGKVSVLAFESMDEAKAHVQRLLDSSIDVASVDVFEFVANGKKVTETVWENV
jgi:hypothetical protein